MPPLSDPNTWFYPFQWSSDGRKLAGFQARADGNFTGINIYSFDTNKYDRVTDFGWSPHWLSDNRRLLFHSELDSKIYLVDTRTRKVHEVLSMTPNDVGFFSISHDDRWIYFTLGVTEDDIWLAHLE